MRTGGIYNNMKKVNVLIVGGGPAGISAAIWCKRLNLSHIMIEKEETLGGQLDQIHNKIIDYPGIIQGNGKEIKELFISHMQQLNCNYLCGFQLKSVDVDNRRAILYSNNISKSIEFDYIVISTGASPRTLGVDGELQMIRRGELYSASKHHHLFADKKVVVVGGGDRALEGAIILANSGADVTLIHRSNIFRAREEYVLPALEHPNIDMILDSQVTEIIGEGHVGGVMVKPFKGEAYYMETNAIFIRIGIKPNSEPFSNTIDINEKGYINVDEFGKTSRNNIYAVGDVCTEPIYSSISLAVGQGMKVAKHLSLQYQH
jgi:thioredoxin reductase (NADPH)